MLWQARTHTHAFKHASIHTYTQVLWELITQGKPFAGLVAHQVVEAVCDFDERPAWPVDLPQKFTGLRDLANKCWDATPSR